MLPENDLKVLGSIEKAGLSDLATALAMKFEAPCLVGGSVRDAILGRKISDFDFLVRSDADAASGQARKMLGGNRFCLDSDLGTFRLVTSMGGSRLVLDFANWTGPSLAEDLASRDFSINAIAFRLSRDGGGNIVDPTGGVADLASGIIREAGPVSMESDRLRLLRMFRFRCQLGFRIEGSTLRKVADLAPGISGVARERIREEFFKILACDAHSATLADLDSQGLLSRILNHRSTGERLLRPMGGADPAEDAWAMAFDNDRRFFVEAIETGSAGPDLSDAVARGEQFSGDHPFKSFLSLCMLVSHTGTWHDEITVESLKLSNRERDCLKRSLSMGEGWKGLVPNGSRSAGRSSTEDLIREAVGWGDSWPWVCAASGALMTGRGSRVEDSIESVKAWAGFCSDLGLVRKKVNGRDLMTLGIGQGPEVGKILNSVWAAGMIGEWSTREEALASLTGDSPT